MIGSDLAICYHNVKHSVIYNSFNCNTKLSRHIFSDFKVGIILSCGGTKPEAFVTNVLAPSSATDFLENL
jgi:hypothetical protein